MAVADSTVYDAVLKEVWTAQKLEEQLYTDTPLLDRLEKIKPTFQVGDKAVTPIRTTRSGGYSAIPRTGSADLNDPDPVDSEQASWNYTHHWFQIEIETAAADETSGNSLAVASAVDTEVEGALESMRRQLTRQSYRNGNALIAQCGTTTAATEVELAVSGTGVETFGFDSIERGWLHPGLTVDIGTTADEDSIAADRVIAAVEEVAASPSIEISGAAVTTSTSHFVSIRDARVGTTSHEMNGLQLVAGDTSSSVGGLDPDTAGQEVWKPQVDTTAQDLTLQLMYERQRKVMQKTGKPADAIVTSLLQQEKFYNLLQAQVRFAGDSGLSAGNVDSPKLGPVGVEAHPDCPSRFMFFLTMGDLFLVRTEKPQWAPIKYGSNRGVLEWKQGTSRLTSGLVYRIQLGASRRNSHAALTDLNE